MLLAGSMLAVTICSVRGTLYPTRLQDFPDNAVIIDETTTNAAALVSWATIYEVG